MKLNKWTIGMAALGLVSLSPGVRAQSTTAPAPAAIPLTTALSATVISGYVDTSAIWVPGTGDAHPAPVEFNTPQKQDGFNLDAADVKIARAPDTSKWAAGYVLELEYGPDAINPFAGTPIRQAYVELMAPIGNGLDFEIGQWDGVLGYESSDSYKNPNFTRSYGKSLEPTSHTGVLATYKFSDVFSAQVGIADSLTGAGNANSAVTGQPESKKAYIGLLSLTAPDSWGSLKGSTIYGGFEDGPGALNNDRQELYVGTTINTPVKGLTFGASWDAVWSDDMTVTTYTAPTPTPTPAIYASADTDVGYNTSYAGYLSYAVTDKMTVSARGEYFHGNATFVVPFANAQAYNADILGVTGTLAYQLWDNVTSRVEVRWDHACNDVGGHGGDMFGGTPGNIGSNGYVTPTEKNEVMVAANIIYKF
jgi:hypothetical protein